MASIGEISRSMEDSPYFRHIGFKICQMDEEKVLLELKVKEELLNINYTLHGGVHASMLDAVQTMAVRALYKCRAAAVNQNIHYTAPVKTGTIYARAQLFQTGYKIAAAEAEIFDKDDRVIAKGSGVYKIVK